VQQQRGAGECVARLAQQAAKRGIAVAPRAWLGLAGAVAIEARVRVGDDD
jgi:hypothetical protein